MRVEKLSQSVSQLTGLPGLPDSPGFPGRPGNPCLPGAPGDPDIPGTPRPPPGPGHLRTALFYPGLLNNKSIVLVVGILDQSAVGGGTHSICCNLFGKTNKTLKSENLRK